MRLIDPLWKLCWQSLAPDIGRDYVAPFNSQAKLQSWLVLLIEILIPATPSINTSNTSTFRSLVDWYLNHQATPRPWASTTHLLGPSTTAWCKELIQPFGGFIEIWTYCWWEEIPRPTTVWMVYKTLQNNWIKGSQPQLVFCRIIEPLNHQSLMRCNAYRWTKVRGSNLDKETLLARRLHHSMMSFQRNDTLPSILIVWLFNELNFDLELLISQENNDIYPREIQHVHKKWCFGKEEVQNVHIYIYIYIHVLKETILYILQYYTA